MTVFTLKIIALASMVIDHAGIIMPEFFGLSPGINIFRVIGRLAFPIFVYLIAEGFRHTKSPEKFLLRLGAFALISEIPFDIAFEPQINFLAGTNIFYTLFLGGVAIYAHQKLHEEKPAYLPACAAVLAAEFLTADYGAYGVAFIFLMYLIKPVKWRLAAMAALCLYQHESTIRGVLRGDCVPAVVLLMIPATLVPVALVAFYNGERGPGLKWLFYAAYPAHILILLIIEGGLL